jgi:hypothetical protein
MLNDWHPYIFRTTDYGATWTKLTTGNNGIPDDFPTRVIREDPDREGLLYAGTEFGMFLSFDDGLNWIEFQQNLPVVPVTDIKIHQKDLVMSTMGRGFWIMDNISTLHEIPLNGLNDVLLFKPNNTYRSNISKGLSIDYYLPLTVDEIKLEIQDLSGKIISNINATKNKGFHRLNWRLYVDMEENSSADRRRPSGPKVVPGEYTAFLQAGDIIQKQNFFVLPDPRIPETEMSQSDYQDMYELCLDVASLQSSAKKFQKEVEALINKKEGKKQKAKTIEKIKALKEVRSLLITDSGPYPQPMMLSQISYLNSMISRADQKPGNHAFLRYEELKSQLENLELEFNKLK